MKNIVSIIAVTCVFASCGSGSDKQAELLQAQQKTVDSMRTEMVKKQTIDSMNNVAAQQSMVNQEQPVMVSSGQSRQGTARPHNTSNTTTNNYNSTPQPAVNTTPQPVATTQPKKKKGWSAKAKGAAVGTGVGIVTGVLVDKKKGEGALVGGLIGGAVGLGAGAIIDKKQKR
jgi:hypothetical protein